MIVIYSKNSVPIRVTKERWGHITRRHPEMGSQKEKVEEQEGDFGELLAVRFYPKTPLTKKYLVIAYKEIPKQGGFILTAYFTGAPSKRRRVLWKH